MSDRFNALPGMSCQPADGAMYLLPRLEIPDKAVAEAKKRGKEADVMYCLDMLGEWIQIPFTPSCRESAPPSFLDLGMG